MITREADQDVLEMGDALGAALRYCWNGGQIRQDVPETLEFANGHTVSSPLARYFDTAQDWTELDRWALAHCAGDVLDIGTGAGRFALDLVKLGLARRISAIEGSAGAAELARERGLGDVETTDWRLFRPRRTFDTITMLGNNLGLLYQFDTPSQGLDLLRTWVPAGGRLIGFGGVPALLPDEVPRERVGSGVRFDARHRFERLRSSWFRYGFTEPEEIAAWAREAGWAVSSSRREPHRWALVLTAE